jgi:DNA-binding MarR family transcriptional regulator
VLVQQGLVIREADPLDGRRVFVELAPDASVALRSYFAELGTTKAP